MPMRWREPLPSLEGTTEWVNGEMSPEQLAGRPVLIHFWAVSCYICKESLPHLNEWRDTFGEQYNLKLIGIHMPRSEKDTNINAVKEMVAHYGLKHPIAIDNDLVVTDAFQNQCVPAYYLFDAQGQMRFYGAGEKAIGMVEQRLYKILGPKGE